ncbi:MAG TPA: hypothetical protein VHE54_08710 [Puia sp.]|nr:hypothetical protein [Puia sp.]
MKQPIALIASRTLVLAASLALLVVSCKKSKPSSSSNSITADMNDTAKTFNVNAGAQLLDLGGYTALSIYGNATSAQDLEGLNLSINNTPGNKPIVAGTYTENSTDFSVGAVYNPGSNVIVYGAGVIPNPTHPLTITITSIDKNSVKGTFSGDFIYTNTATGTFGTDVKTFTNGQFNVQMH